MATSSRTTGSVPTAADRPGQGEEITLHAQDGYLAQGQSTVVLLA
jgi:hypothetical protein